jgi:hypothetical protein
MAHLRIQALKISVTTNGGEFGLRIDFSSGLNIIHAKNTSGKSTALMSVLYALGFEGMLGPSHEPPLTAAMLKTLTHKGSQYRVLESVVFLEIEGHDGEVVTLQRQATGELKARQLTVVHDGPFITRPNSYKRSSYLVRTRDSAQGEAGFHRFLASFIGLDLPNLADFEGEPTPLYLECIFPFFFVEQLTGWRDIKARMPTYLQVPEMAKRSAEYVMNLDILYRSLKRQALKQQAKKISIEWEKALDQSLFGSFGLGFVIRGIPEKPVPVWPPHQVTPNLYVLLDLKWRTIDTVIELEKKQVRRLTAKAIPRAEEATIEAQVAIVDLESQHREIEADYTRRLAETATDEDQLRAIQERLASLREDRRKYRDEQMLQSRGASTEFNVQADHCPVCDRPLNDTLLSHVRLVNPMSLQENITFINDQITTFEFMEVDATQTLNAKHQMLITARATLFDISARSRLHKELLRSDGHVPSEAAIRERLQHEARLERLTALSDAFADRLKHFARLSQEWRTVLNELDELRDLQLTPEDKRKLDVLEQSFKSQLQAYDFSSFPVEDVGISRDSYRPSHQGYDLGFTSASDTIRAIWAYLLGLLELSRQTTTNHLGLVVFDEPKQQSAAKYSLGALLERASSAVMNGQQVIFATSEEEASLTELVAACTQTPMVLRFVRVITIIDNDPITIIDARFRRGNIVPFPFCGWGTERYSPSSAETMPTSRRAADLASPLERLQHLA